MYVTIFSDQIKLVKSGIGKLLTDELKVIKLQNSNSEIKKTNWGKELSREFIQDVMKIVNSAIKLSKGKPHFDNTTTIVRIIILSII